MRSGAPWPPAKGSILSAVKPANLPSKQGTLGRQGSQTPGANLLKEGTGAEGRGSGLGKEST